MWAEISPLPGCQLLPTAPFRRRWAPCTKPQQNGGWCKPNVRRAGRPSGPDFRPCGQGYQEGPALTRAVPAAPRLPPQPSADIWGMIFESMTDKMVAAHPVAHMADTRDKIPPARNSRSPPLTPLYASDCWLTCRRPNPTARDPTGPGELLFFVVIFVTVIVIAIIICDKLTSEVRIWGPKTLCSSSFVFFISFLTGMLILTSRHVFKHFVTPIVRRIT